METDLSGLYYGKLNEDYTYLVNELDKSKWDFTGNSNSRQVQHYGYKYNYLGGINGNINTKTTDIPAYMDKLIKEITDVCNSNNLLPTNYKFNQLIVNNYFPGQGISAHVDNIHYGCVIACITLGKGCIITFRKGNDERDIYVEDNTLYIMSGDARYKWTHEIKKVKTDYVNGVNYKRDRRVSLTFRYVKE
jgi:alkylated DNA repair dioxygenase AlkB